MNRLLVFNIVSAITSFCSIVSLISFPQLPVWLKIIILVIALACAGYIVWFSVVNNRKNEIVCHTDEEIKAEMKKLISQQGKVCIMSRDLSWVDVDIFSAIIKKKDSVIIYAEKENERVEELRENGVKIKLYGMHGFVPETRFTIIRYGRANPQISIADTRYSIRKGNLEHKIYQTTIENQSDGYILSLARDLTNLMEKVSES